MGRIVTPGEIRERTLRRRKLEQDVDGSTWERRRSWLALVLASVSAAATIGLALREPTIVVPAPVVNVPAPVVTVVQPPAQLPPGQ